jgi:Uma2 family endonuclease
MATLPTADVLPVVAPADHVIGPPQGQWTYAAYAALPDDGRRYEVIGGVLYVAPAPTDTHQATSTWLIYYLTTYVQVPGLGRVFGAPLDVRMPGEDTVQPDVLVVMSANLGRVTAEGVQGPPDLVIEIASPSTATYDRDKKLHAYERGGVPEYWIVDPIARAVEVFVAEENLYRSLGVFQGGAMLPSTVIPDLPVRVARFFE